MPEFGELASGVVIADVESFEFIGDLVVEIEEVVVDVVDVVVDVVVGSSVHSKGESLQGHPLGQLL